MGNRTLLALMVASVSLAMSACASWAATAPAKGMVDVCKASVNHVHVLVGEEGPLPPDVGANGETSQQEWDFADGNMLPVTVRCFAGATNDTAEQMTAPTGAKRCVLQPSATNSEDKPAYRMLCGS